MSGFSVLAQDGTRVYEFLNITTSARMAALGGNAQSAWDADPNGSLWNPALMNEEMHGQIGINYVNYLADIAFGSASAVYQLNDESFVSIHGQYVDYGDFRGTDEIGNETGNFSANDAAITVGYARRLGDFFTVGANLKYINSRIETYSSSALAADIGVVFHDIDYNTNVSLSIRNFGYQLKTYDGTRENMPVQINLGITHQLEYVPLALTMTLHDLQKFDISMPYAKNGEETTFGRKVIDHISVGAELFPQQGFNMRVGYNFKRGNELSMDGIRAFSGLTYGFGIRVHAFRLEYSRANYHKSGGSNHFGLIVNLDRLISGSNYYRSIPYR